MKINLIAFAIMQICIIHAAAQKINSSQVPVVVQNAFLKQFPNAKAERWELEDRNYEAGFDVKGMDWSALYFPNGICMETEEEIHSADIPTPVSNAISNSFAGYKTGETDKVTKNDGAITFEVVLQRGKEQIEVVFDPSGKVLSKENTNDDKD